MANNIANTCKVLEDLPSCLSAPAHAVPTVQYRLLNLDLPFDKSQVSLFQQQDINLFASNVTGTDQSGQAFETSDNLIADTFSFTTPFIMMGVCIYAYGEPFGFAMDGNQFGSQATLEGLNAMPGSPMLLRSDAAYLAQLGLPNPLGANDFACHSQLEYGSATWKAIWAFMNAYRIIVECPNTSSGEYLINELIADIGNCCSHAIPEGFGASKTSWIAYVRAVNERLRAIRTGQGLPDQTIAPFPVSTGDPGYFLPFNCEQSYNDGAGSTVTPYRQPVDFAAFGREFINPTIEQWYRMTCPIPMDKDTKIRVYLHRNTGNNPYLDRFISEATMQKCMSPIPGNANTVEMTEEAGAQVHTHEPSTFTRIPGGKLRIGVGLKGFFVKPKVCSELQTVLSSGSLGGCSTAGGIIRGDCAVGGCGAR